MENIILALVLSMADHSSERAVSKYCVVVTDRPECRIQQMPLLSVERSQDAVSDDVWQFVSCWLISRCQKHSEYRLMVHRLRYFPRNKKQYHRMT